ncbi:calmodulin-regulated spectrin-associated protein 3 isoform X1 [Nothobranchius furzeri]|uniref:Calmodulin regulated spectrin associated protein family member 3 n=3 Tax=Nothobranchius furzeri TaxID=105023 RepID=A0A1A7ZVB3_NOTFU|nr:calmodulin-regulated spectrin-associated protein 3 isoform X1 [Nothobranchius furzeri]KAF7223660.1 transcript variant X1 [Nothobranchius furzeri]
MVDSPGAAVKKTFTVPEIKPLDRYDVNRAKICASVRWLLSKSYGSAENVPVELREPLYKDQYEQEHLKPSITKLLLSPEVYCRAQALLAPAHGVSPPASQGPPADNSALLQFLTKKGLSPKVQDVDITEEDLNHTPINTKAHLALIDSLMSLAAKEVVGQVKMAEEAEQIGVGAPWENALLFWVNRLNQKLRESTEEEELPKTNTCTDLQPVQETSQSTRWYWKLVPHAIAFCLKESGNKPPVIRYRKDKVQSKLTPTFPLVSAVKDLSNGCAIAAAVHYYCPGLLPLEDVCLKDTMSVADSFYNLQLIKEFCESSLQSGCPLAVEDLLYAPPTLHLNIMSFIAELLECFEVKKPDFVKPVQPIDLTDISGLLDCTSPVSGNSNSGSPSFIFKQPFVPIPSLVSTENKNWTKKQISRPLSAVTFSIPFGLDSDVDIVMGNPIDSVFRSVSTDNLTTGIPALTSTATSAGMTCVSYSPPEDLSHLVSASAPAQRSSWGPYAHTAPLGELPTIEEVRQVVHIPDSKDRKKGGTSEKSGRAVFTGRPEPRLRPEGAPAGFFLHSPEENNSQLSSSAPCRSGVLCRPVRGEAGDHDRQGKRERSKQYSMSRDDDSVLRDGSIDSSEASDDLPRNTPGNIRPSNGRHGNHSSNSSPCMTSFAERRDNRRRQAATPGEESASAPTPTTPGTPHTPSTPAGASGHQHQLDGPASRGPELSSEAWELGARLEEKRKSIEAQKRRIEAIFAKHRQRLGKTAFLQLKREQGEGGVEGAEEDNLTLEERLTRMEEQLKQDEEKVEKERETEKEKPSVSDPPRLEKQVTFSIDNKKGGEKEKGVEKGGEAVVVEYNEVVQKLGEALQSLQRDMQKLTEQQQQLLSNQRPGNTPKNTSKPEPRSFTKTPPRTPTKTPPRTPTKTPTRSTSKAWVIPSGPGSPAGSSPSRRSHLLTSSTSPKTSISSSCPAPRTKTHSSSTPCSPKNNPRLQHHPHPRPSELKFPTLNRVLTPTQNVDTLPHLRRVSPSKCQVQTSSSFRIGEPPTPKQPPQPFQQLQPEESTSDTGSSETPTQFSLELEQEDAEEVGALPVLPQSRQDRLRAAGGSSSGAPSECSFESDTLSLSAAYSTGVEGERGEGAGKPCSLIEASFSSAGGPEGGSDEPTDEGQEFSSDSMSDHTESATDAVRELHIEQLDPVQQLNLATEAKEAPELQTGPAEGPSTHAETAEVCGEKNELESRGGIGFFFKEDVHSEGEMAQRKALLLERQQRRTEELKKRRQWNEQERENRPASSERRVASPSSNPPAGTTSLSPTPPATPARRGDFTRGEYARRHQLRIMEDLDKVLKQKSTHQSRSAKKSRSRPRSMTREETQLSLSPAKGPTGSKLTKAHSQSSLNLAATDEPGNPTKKPQSNSPSRCVTPNKSAHLNGDKDWESGSSGNSPGPDYTGPKLFKEPSFKSNKFIIHNALSRCCLAGKVNESQKSKIIEEMEKSSANHFLILFRDSSCQFRGVYTLNPDSQELVRLTGVGPRMVNPTQVESLYKYSSDRKQFSAIPSKTMGMSIDAFTIPGHLWQGGGGAGGAGGGGRRASITKKAVK